MAATAPIGVTIERYDGQRSRLLALFAEADDSPSEVARYLDSGEVLVARLGRRIVGHVLWIAAGTECEIRSVAVAARERGRGIGAALVREALRRAFAAGACRARVATATADIENLRFYQRLGFRMDRVERDAFGPHNGYPAVEVDGVPVRDRVWFTIDATAV